MKINAAFSQDAYIAKFHNIHFFMPQSQKYCAEWNNFCAAYKGDFFTSKQVYLSAHEVWT